MVIEFLGLCPPNDLIGGALVVDFDGQVASIVVSPKFGDFDWLLLKCFGDRRRRHENGFLLQFRCRPAAGAFPLCDVFIYCGGCLRVFVDGNHCLRDNVLLLLFLLVFHVFLWKISEARMRIYGRLRIFPRLVVLVFSARENLLQMILHN